MPIWLQLTAAVSAGAASALMGAAFVPFMKKQRFCEEETPQNGDEVVRSALLPTMGGLLAVFGCLLGFVMAYVLYRTVFVIDYTAVSVQQNTKELLLAIGYALFWALLGMYADICIIRRRPLKRQPMPLRIAFVYIVTLLFLMLCATQQTVLDFGFFRYDAGILSIPLTAAMGTAVFLLTQANGEKTDGMSISVSGVLLLGMAVLFMQEGNELHALLALAAAGACMGCFVWNLHPARCRIGRTGMLWLGAVVTAICLISHLHMAVLLTAAVYLLDRIPCLGKNKKTLQEQLRQADMKPWQNIAVFAGFAAFCMAIAVMLYAAF